jgi:hypothetical protein
MLQKVEQAPKLEQRGEGGFIGGRDRFLPRLLKSIAIILYTYGI